MACHLDDGEPRSGRFRCQSRGHGTLHPNCTFYLLANSKYQWPYTYDSCDVGTVANQTFNGLPVAATINGDTSNGGVLSYLPGQRLSRCTCSGESHPGPMHSDGTYVGRAAPEIDIFEAQVYPLHLLWFSSDELCLPFLQITGTPLSGQVSQSSQWGVGTVSGIPISDYHTYQPHSPSMLHMNGSILRTTSSFPMPLQVSSIPT